MNHNVLPATDVSSLNTTTSEVAAYVADLDNCFGYSVQYSYTNATPSAKTFVSGTAEVQTLTIPTGAAAAASRDFVILTDGSGLTWATYFDTSGTDIAPTAAAYTAVNAARKIKTVITGLAADTDIVTAMKAALNGLTGFTAAITLSGTTTLIVTMVVEAPCADPVVFAQDGIGAATAFSGVQSTAGVTTGINLTTNIVTSVAHGYVTGTKFALTTAGVLPTGVTATNYWLIKVDADSFAFASSLALASAGTKIDLTADGTGTHTITATTAAGNILKLQKSNNNSVWIDINSLTVTGDTSALSSMWEVVDPQYRYLQVIYTPAAGQVTLAVSISLTK